MIPSTNDILNQDFTVTTQPSKTYGMNFNTTRIQGTSDGIEAVKESIYRILNTERYQYLMYSWNYGIELADLFGQPKSFCCAEIERRVTEALSVDDRIESVEGFSFDTSTPRVVAVTFTVNTIFGSTNIETEVAI